MEMVRRYARLGRELGLQFATGINTGLRLRPETQGKNSL